MTAGTLFRLAFAGTRADRLRVALTAASAMLAAFALLAGATVASIRGEAQQYTSALLRESGLRPGVVTAVVLLAIPVLALAGQCIRIGAPARDRRLAALRLAGATPGQAVLIGGAETALASALGSVSALVAFLAVQAALPGPDAHGRLVLPTDVLPSPGAVALVLLAVPLLAGLVGTVLLRRVVIGPLGVVRRTRDRGPRPWAGVVIVLGLVLFALPQLLQEVLPKDRHLSRGLIDALLAAGIVLAMIGVVLGTGWISHATGRLLLRFGSRPAALLAARRLLADPWNGSRTLAALLVGVIAGAIVLGYRALMITEFRATDRVNAMLPEEQSQGFAAEPGFYLGAVRLVLVAVGIAMAVAAAGVLVAVTESIVARRRTYAALTAAGVPRSVLSKAVLWHIVAPLVPALLLALGVGLTIPRLIATEVRAGGGSYDACVGAGEQCTAENPSAYQRIEVPAVTMDVPVPLAELALLGGGALLAMLAVVGVAVLVQRGSTDLSELRAG